MAEKFISHVWIIHVLIWTAANVFINMKIILSFLLNEQDI